MTYKFAIDEEVRIKGIERPGKILSRRWSPCSLNHLSLFPGNYYLIRTRGIYRSDGEITIDQGECEFPEKYLEKLVS